MEDLTSTGRFVLSDGVWVYVHHSFMIRCSEYVIQKSLSDAVNKSFRSFKNKSSYFSKDTGIVGTLPVLVIATSLKPSNLHVCLEKWPQHVLLNYGEIGSIFSELSYPKPSAPELPAAEDLANDDTGLIRSTNLEKLKVFEKRKEDSSVRLNIWADV